MSFEFTNIENTYLVDRYKFILFMEESGNERTTPYNDGKGLVTIGIGFNLRVSNVREKVLGIKGVGP